MSAAPSESTSTTPERSESDNLHPQALLLRPSPINLDMPMDPKQLERIVLDDALAEKHPNPPEKIIEDNSKLEQDRTVYSLYYNDTPSHENHTSVLEQRDESKDNKSHSGNKQDDYSSQFRSNERTNDDKSYFNKYDINENNTYGHHDYKRESVVHVPVESDLTLKESVQPKTLVQPITSGEPTIVYATKPDERRPAIDGVERRPGIDGFVKRPVIEGLKTSHPIPDVYEGERPFKTIRNIPSHDERRSAGNAKDNKDAPSTLHDIGTA